MEKHKTMQWANGEYCQIIQMMFAHNAEWERDTEKKEEEKSNIDAKRNESHWKSNLNANMQLQAAKNNDAIFTSFVWVHNFFFSSLQ